MRVEAWTAGVTAFCEYYTYGSSTEAFLWSGLKWWFSIETSSPLLDAQVMMTRWLTSLSVMASADAY